MNFVTDEQLPAELVVWLRARGHDAAHVDGLGLKSTPDPSIFRHAASIHATIVTKDKDYTLLRTLRRIGPQILWIRAPNQSNAELLALMERVWSDVEARLGDGAPVVVVNRDESVSAMPDPDQLPSKP